MERWGWVCCDTWQKKLKWFDNWQWCVISIGYYILSQLIWCMRVAPTPSPDAELCAACRRCCDGALPAVADALMLWHI